MNAVFCCDFCGEPAATVEMVPQGVPHPDALASETAAGTLVLCFFGRISEVVGPDRYLALQAALAAGGPRALYDLDRFWAPFYCPECDRCYCIEHWQVETVFDSDFAGWYDCSYGTCPQGHRRMIDD